MSRILSRKQLWRRQRGCRPDSFESRDFLYREGLGADTPSALRAAVSDQLINRSEDMAPAYNGKPHFSTDDLRSYQRTSNTREKKKALKFNTAVHVVLIPTRYDYKSVGLGQVMWWADEDYNQFKNEATSELKLYMSSYSEFNCKKAIEILYQPSDVDILSDVVQILHVKSTKTDIQISDDARSNFIEDADIGNSINSSTDEIKREEVLKSNIHNNIKIDNNNDSSSSSSSHNNKNSDVCNILDATKSVRKSKLDSKNVSEEVSSTPALAIIPQHGATPTSNITNSISESPQASSFTEAINSLTLQRTESNNKINSPQGQRSRDDLDVLFRKTFLKVKTDVDLITPSTFHHKHPLLNMKPGHGFRQMLVSE